MPGRLCGDCWPCGARAQVPRVGAGAARQGGQPADAGAAPHRPAPPPPSPWQVPESWLPPLELPGQGIGPGGVARSPSQSPLQARLGGAPSGLRAVSREGARAPPSALSTPTSAAPSGELSIGPLAAGAAAAWCWEGAVRGSACTAASQAGHALLCRSEHPAVLPPCLLCRSVGRLHCPGASTADVAQLCLRSCLNTSRNPLHPCRAVLGVSRGASTADMAGLSDLLDPRSPAPADPQRRARAGWGGPERHARRGD